MAENDAQHNPEQPLNGDTKCIECEQPTTEGRCINSECGIAQRQASIYASRATAKAGAQAALERPRAFTRSGGVD